MDERPPADDLPAAVAAALERVVTALPGGEVRPGQAAMAAGVAAAVAGDRHLLVQAGTGTGKSLAYLVPAVLSGRRTVVATATKALQEQLVARDLPAVARHVGVPFTVALLKGRSNYLCRAALQGVLGAGDAPTLAIGDDRGAAGAGADRWADVAAWAESTPSGDRADLPVPVSDAEWAALSVSPAECPGAARCPHGDTCFAERARAEAAAADVVVVNTHLYARHLAAEGAVLPDHDVVVIDEAHALEDVMVAGFGRSLGPGRFAAAARAVRALFTADDRTGGQLEAAGERLAAALAPWAGRRVDPAEAGVAEALTGAGEVLAAVAGRLRALPAGGDAAARRERAVQLCSQLAVDVRAVQAPGEGEVAWVEGGPAPALRLAPVDVAGALAEHLFGRTTAVLTSATLTVGGSFAPVAERLGLDPATVDTLDVGSPFDYEAQALLYCAAHLPDPRRPEHEPAMLAELEDLVRAAGGRTLALFTSRRAMEAAAAHLEGRLPWRLLVQDRLPRPVLLDAFRDDETSCLLATMGFWQGFDAPGRTCSLVVIDRLPFARPDDPLAEARRAAATRQRRNAFTSVDLPRAAVLLAQGAGRLVRSSSDRGVVAVLDRRLATAGYRWDLVRSLPPMRRTKDPAVARAVLAELAAAPAPAV